MEFSRSRNGEGVSFPGKLSLKILISTYIFPPVVVFSINYHQSYKGLCCFVIDLPILFSSNLLPSEPQLSLCNCFYISVDVNLILQSKILLEFKVFSIFPSNNIFILNLMTPPPSCAIFLTVIVSVFFYLSYYNKILQTRQLVWNGNLFPNISEARKSKLKVPTGAQCRIRPALFFIDCTLFHETLRRRKGKGDLWGLFPKSTNLRDDA